MRRRAFITLAGGAAAALVRPRAARAQQPALPVIGFLGSDTPEHYADRLRALRQGLREAGFVEGQNLAIAFRWAEGRNDRLPSLAAELVRDQVAVIVTSTTPTVLAVKAATATIPIVFFVAGDPVALGLVASLSHPGGNLTGTTTLTLEVSSKWLQLLHEMAPAAPAFAVLVNPTSSKLAETQSNDLEISARSLGLRIHLLQASTEADFETAFATVAQLGAGGLVITSDSFFFAHIKLLAGLAERHKVPAIFGFREFAAAGGLMSYGASVTDQHRILGAYAGRILKGEKPADLPVQQSTKVELVISMKAAKALGVTVPLSLLGRADEVIE